MTTALVASAAGVVGAVVGTTLHELAHALAVWALGGSVTGVGWQTGPIVYWSHENYTDRFARAVGLAPLGMAAIVVAAALRWQPSTFPQIWFLTGVVVMCCKLSPSDLYPARARELAVDRILKRDYVAA